MWGTTRLNYFLPRTPAKAIAIAIEKKKPTPPPKPPRHDAFVNGAKLAVILGIGQDILHCVGVVPHVPIATMACVGLGVLKWIEEDGHGGP